MNYNFLNKINSPKDLKLLSNQELDVLAKEIRNEIISTISKTGGHIASSLGVVELTIAIHKIFDAPKDKIIWDVGHQTYAHKLLTGRRSRFKTIRQEDGLSGFPRQLESEYDAFIAGHSSTSISAACGISKAIEILGEDAYTIAVIGDGALTGGLAYEGLNNASKTGKEKLVVILNDNNMSISKNVGAMAKYLSKIRTAQGYFKLKDNINKGISKFPLIGSKIRQTIVKSKVMLKESVYHSNVFENLGFEYLGPLNGHDITSLCNVLERAKQLKKPVLIHVNTIKGKGYRIAEQNPSKYHGITKEVSAIAVKEKSKSFSDVFGEVIVDIASKNKKVVAITAAMKNGTGLENFSKEYPKRFFDVGIAEQHAVTFAAGLAAKGCVPVFVVYSTFLQRGFDQVIHDAAIENQHIVLAVDRAGIVGEDGETHQGIFDVSFLSMIPNVTIFSPTTYSDLKNNMEEAVYNCSGIVAVRYPKGKEVYIRREYTVSSSKSYHIWHQDGNDKLVITYGRLFAMACDLKDSMDVSQNNISVLKLNKIWPIEDEVVKLVSDFKKVIFVEESIKNGGIAEHFGIKLMENNYNGKYIIRAIENQFVAQATVDKSLAKLGFTVHDIEQILK